MKKTVVVILGVLLAFIVGAILLSAQGITRSKAISQCLKQFAD